MPTEISKHSAKDAREEARSFRSRGWTNLMQRREIERLAERVQVLEREKASVEAFAAVAAHELLEPLILAESYVALVNERLDEPGHAETRRDLDLVARSARRSRILIELLLHDARTSGRELDRRTVDVKALVEDCVSVLRSDIEAREADIRIEPLPVVDAEEPLLAGVIKNLLTNALKYTPRCGGVIRVGGSRNGGEPLLFVESNGPTIPEEERQRIFAPFHRGRDERRARGTGLGLAICKEIVERHGGTIAVVPGAAGGNRFTFTIPSARA